MDSAGSMVNNHRLIIELIYVNNQDNEKKM